MPMLKKSLCGMLKTKLGFIFINKWHSLSIFNHKWKHFTLFEAYKGAS